MALTDDANWVLLQRGRTELAFEIDPGLVEFGAQLPTFVNSQSASAELKEMLVHCRIKNASNSDTERVKLCQALNSSEPITY